LLGKSWRFRNVDLLFGPSTEIQHDKRPHYFVYAPVFGWSPEAGAFVVGVGLGADVYGKGKLKSLPGDLDV